MNKVSVSPRNAVGISNRPRMPILLLKRKLACWTGGVPEQGFFDSYPRFYSTSQTANHRRRLNKRYVMLIEANEMRIRGESVLDLVSHDGRWSLAAHKAGARIVLGIEAREHLVSLARANMDAYQVPNDRVRFVWGDVFQELDKIRPGSFDTVFCFGLFHHTMHHMLLLSKIARLAPTHVILDTQISLNPDPTIEVSDEPVNREGAGAMPDPGNPDQIPVGKPSRFALELMLSRSGFSFSYCNWHRLGVKRSDYLGDYHRGARVSLVATSKVDLRSRMMQSAAHLQRFLGHLPLVHRYLPYSKFRVTPRNVVHISNRLRMPILLLKRKLACWTGGPEQGFFDSYPRFYSTSQTANHPRRLNKRYLMLIEANEMLIRGKSVLDLASHDGRWSLAAHKAGARTVLGIEAREHLVSLARANMDAYQVPNDRVRFVWGDVFQELDKIRPGSFDTVFCFGLFYHTMQHMLLLSKIARLGPRHVILDTHISLDPNPTVEVNDEPLEREGAGAVPDPGGSDRIVVGKPSRLALELMLSRSGFSFSYCDWHRLGVKRWHYVEDYHKGDRVCLVATSKVAFC